MRSLVERLQRRFVDALGPDDFALVEWLRDGGQHGGGARFVCAQTPSFNRASINVSCVHYDDAPARPVAAATALSAIVHPHHPHAPSIHLHLSFTELRDGHGGWRLMADLNPSNEDAAQAARFEASLREAAPAHFAAAQEAGARYFFIPALSRHRGVSHFYLEDFSTADFEADLALAERVGRSTIDTYAQLIAAAAAGPAPSDAAFARQLGYHTLYLFQVLTLDRGTTSGLLAHDQNDLGTMGSLPSFVDRALLASWEPKLPRPQDELLRAIVSALPAQPPAHVTDEVRLALAKIVRAHYRAHPEAVALQAAGPATTPAR